MRCITVQIFCGYIYQARNNFPRHNLCFKVILTFVLGRGVPQTIYRSTSKIMPVANEIFPEAEEASDLYIHINNGQLTIFPKFGPDPLLRNEHKMNQRLGRFL